MKRLYMIVIFVGLCSLFIFVPKQVHAESSNAYTANITVDGSNNILVNSQQTSEDYVANGSTVNVTFNNNAGYQILICSKGSTAQAIANGSSAMVPVTVNAEAELVVSLSSGNCSNGSGSPGYLYIEGATGTLSCSIVDGKVWNITGQYSYIPQTIYLYRGSTYIADIQASSGDGGYYYNAPVNEEFSGQSSAITYYLYDGTSNTDELIGHAACPAIQFATTPSSSVPTNTTTLSTNTNAAASPTTTTSSSLPQEPATTSNTTTNEATKPATNTTVKKISDSNTSLYIASSLVLFFIALLLVLNFTNVWTKPKELLIHAWSKIRGLKQSNSSSNKPEEPKAS